MKDITKFKTPIEYTPPGVCLTFVKKTGIGYSTPSRYGTLAVYICDCGKEVVCLIRDVKSKRKKSCGCQAIKYKHSLCKHPLYTIWLKIKSRCYDPNHKAYSAYGSRGVKMCDEWNNNFKSFYDWAISNGWVRKLEIDKDIIPFRLNIPAILYSPEMCSIVTKKENAQYKTVSRIIEYNGERRTLKEWSEYTGISYASLQHRLDSKKMKFGDAIANKNMLNRFLEYSGETLSITEWSKKLGIGASTLLVRIDRLKWSVEKAISTPLRSKIKQ